jgi:hypothetical protein
LRPAPFRFTGHNFYAFLMYHMTVTCPAHLILHDLITVTIFGGAYKLWSFSLCSLLQSHAISSLLGTNIPLSTLFPNILNLCSSLTVRYHVSNPWKNK